MAQREAAVFGHITGIPVGTKFRSRQELFEAAVHGQLQAGIHGDSSRGAFSICLSGGYEDDRDLGKKITYVGSGGRNDDGRQVANQSLDDPHNKSLLVSCETKRPVRVIRGADDNNHYSPPSGFRYDGLYVVDKAEMRPGKSGFQMCFFELRRLEEEGQVDIPSRRLLTQKKMADMLRRARK